jgi:peptidoglycan/xylan/chitin deacetylase (PgdA/CDA1 family)
MRPITLSFDNGPTPGVTEHVLGILADHRISATFFCVGEKLATPEGRKLAERAREAGHWIANHSFSHSIPLGENPTQEYAEHEINDTQAQIGSLAHAHRYFRPFGGGGFLDTRLLSEPARDALVDGRYSCVLWNCVPGDWLDAGWVERALHECSSIDWPLVVLHDIPDASLARLDEFLGALRAAGYEFRQEFPEECVPILDGKVRGDLTPYIRSIRN